MAYHAAMGFPSPGTDNTTLRRILGELQAQRAGERHPFEDLLLEADQERVLATMVEAERLVSREQSPPFILVGAHGEGYSLVHTALPENVAVAAGDVRSLAEAGLLRRSLGSRGSENYEVTNQGRAYHTWMKERDGEPLERVEAEVRHLLDGANFQARHQAAYTQWSEAEAALWDAKTIAQFTSIGHACREAVQLFITDLVELHRPATVEPDPQRTVNRLRAVLEGADLPDAVSAYANVLLAHFRAVNGLVQRQVHGGQKEGDPLTWEDARRVVFATAFVMFELNRVLA